jgi:hypothetical protein
VFVPIVAGGYGVFEALHEAPGSEASHIRYLSGLLLGIGVAFSWASLDIVRRGAVIRTLAFLVVVGGLARLIGAFQDGWSSGVVLPLIMELGVTPTLALWRERVERLLREAEAV